MSLQDRCRRLRWHELRLRPGQLAIVLSADLCRRKSHGFHARLARRGVTGVVEYRRRVFFMQLRHFTVLSDNAEASDAQSCKTKVGKRVTMLMKERQARPKWLNRSRRDTRTAGLETKETGMDDCHSQALLGSETRLCFFQPACKSLVVGYPPQSLGRLATTNGGLPKTPREMIPVHYCEDVRRVCSLGSWNGVE
jgi:hypothetical protein